MELCTGASALELAAAAASFLLIIFLLDVLWVRLPEEFGRRDREPDESRQRLLNLFVALGAIAAAVMLIVWSGACGA